jgi:probable phosphoglycerate mutase
VIVLQELAELHHGKLAGMTNDEIATRHPGVLEQRETDKYNWRFPGGESYREAAERATRALDLVNAAGSRTPAIVTHEMIGRMLLASLINLAPLDALATELPHGSVVEVRTATAEFTAQTAGAEHGRH